MNAAEAIKTVSIARGDLELFGVVKQVCEITGSSHDVAATTLFDCNYDVERAVDKIFERGADGGFNTEDMRDDVWKEVAKVRRKCPTVEGVVVEETKNEYKTEDEIKGRGRRGSSKGRTRGGQRNEVNTRGSVRGRGRRPQGQRGWAKIRGERDTFSGPDEDFNIPRVENHNSEWIMDDIESETFTSNDCATKLSTVTLEEENPVEIVAKYTRKDGVFGDFSRTKAPPRSTISATAPIKLVTPSGVMSSPSSAFHFGLDFSAYCVEPSEIVNIKKVIDDVSSSKRISDDNNGKRLSVSEDSFSRVPVGHDDVVRIHSNQEDVRRIPTSSDDIRRVHDIQEDPRHILGDIEPRKILLSHKDSHDIMINAPSSITSYSSSLPLHHTSESCETTFPSMLPSSPQLCPPPGMSNAHILQQFHNNHQYLSLMNLPSGTPMYDISSSSNDNSQLVHSLDSKEFLSKNSKSNEHDHSTVLNTMAMPNLCCFPQVYMNNFPNFLPPVPGHNNPSVDSSQQQSPSPLSTNNPHRNYPHEDFSNDSNKYDDGAAPNKHKYVRTPNYVPSYVSGNSGMKDDSQHDKVSRQQMGANVNRSGQQQTISNDPRFLTFHQQQSHGYPNNMYNCVPAQGTHPSGAHPYAMAHQPGGIQQLHLMQQQMHNFPQSYQFQEHMMTSMVPNGGNNRSNGGGSNGNQPSRNNRSGNTLWHPSNS